MSLISISHLLQDLLNLETILARFISKETVKNLFFFAHVQRVAFTRRGGNLPPLSPWTSITSSKADLRMFIFQFKMRGLFISDNAKTFKDKRQQKMHTVILRKFLLTTFYQDLKKKVSFSNTVKVIQTIPDF